MIVAPSEPGRVERGVYAPDWGEERKDGIRFGLPARRRCTCSPRLSRARRHTWAARRAECPLPQSARGGVRVGVSSRGRCDPQTPGYG